MSRRRAVKEGKREPRKRILRGGNPGDFAGVPCYVISRTTDLARRDRCMARLRATGFEPEHFPALEPVDVVTEDLPEFRGRKLTGAEVACAETHKTLWFHIWETKAEVAYIFEDDAMPLVDGRCLDLETDALHSERDPAMMILHRDRLDTMGQTQVLDGKWVETYEPPVGLYAYAINAAMADKLTLLAPDTWTMPVDEWMRKAEIEGIYVHSDRGFFTEDFALGSTQSRFGIPSVVPRTIHQIWIGGAEMPPRMVEWMRTVSKSHKVELWNERSINAEFWQHPAWRAVEDLHPAVQADVARILVLEKFGGLYLDTDVELLRDPWEAFGTYGATLVEDPYGGLATCAMACAPGHPLFSRMAEDLADSIKTFEPHGPHQDTWCERVLFATGPKFVDFHRSSYRNAQARAGVWCEYRTLYDTEGRSFGWLSGDQQLVLLEPWAGCPTGVDEPFDRELHGDAVLVHHYETSWNPHNKPPHVAQRREVAA